MSNPEAISPNSKDHIGPDQHQDITETKPLSNSLQLVPHKNNPENYFS